jgi:hypothetical protein
MAQTLTPMSAVQRFWSAVRWYTREFFGENAYDKYLVRHYLAHTPARAAGLNHQPLSRRQFYRQLSDAAADIRGCC